MISRQASYNHQLRGRPKLTSRVAACASTGKCWLVGAGPGPVDYLTIKAARLLREAEVVVYDDLVNEDALEYAASAEKVYVGKRGGKASTAQQNINEVLVSYCSQGKQVVRLKGGCPSVFSRVSSEMDALAAAGIPYELVPGISSALAAPLLQGFPLTHVTQGPSFTVLTGHDLDLHDWPALARLPTLVILMGGRQLPNITRRLLENGAAAETPVCIIRAAGTVGQEVWQAPLGDIVREVEGQALSPCTIIVGRVSALAPNPEPAL